MRHAFPDELARTNPDLLVHDPTAGVPREWDDPGFFWLNEQLLVVRTGETGLLATWTSERLNPHVLRVACSRSEDGGQTWLGAEYIDGDGIGDGGPAAWQVPVIGPTGRIYLLYNYSPQPGAGPFCGGLRCRTSDDGGATWSLPADLRFPRSSIDSPDTDRPSIWISIAVPPVTDSGRALLGFTRWADNPGVAYGGSGIKERYSHIEFLRFENLGEIPEAEDVQLTPLNVEKPITVPREDCQSASFAQEPYTVALPDGRFLMAMRTNRGQAWYALSEEGGVDWSQPQPMLNEDGGRAMLHPVAPCPVFRLSSHEYLFLFHNNDGYAFGAESRWDVRNRRPASVCLGQYRPDAEQPIWWGAPHMLIDNEAVPWGPEGKGRLEAAAYPSMTRTSDGHILWYPDRKGFLVGKHLRDEWLGTLEKPRKAEGSCPW